MATLIREQLKQNMGEYFTAAAIATKVLATIQNEKMETSMDDAFAIDMVLQMLTAVDQSYQLQRIDIGNSSYTREDILENLPTKVDSIKADMLALVNNPDISSYEEVTLGDLAGKYITLVFAQEEIRLEFCQQDECFIATAAFGSKLQPAVVLLRQFRDKVLLANNPGRTFVAFYYQNSPPIAHYIAGNETAKLMVRILLLPFITIAYMVMNPIITVVLLLLLLSIVLYRRRVTLQP